LVHNKRLLILLLKSDSRCSRPIELLDGKEMQQMLQGKPVKL
jgi:hypothetical protein